MRHEVDEIHRLGAELWVIGNGTPAQAAWFVDDQRWTTPVLTDPTLKVHERVGLKRGRKYTLSPKTVAAAVRAYKSGHRQEGIEGDRFQQGGALVVKPGGEVTYAFAADYPGHHPDPKELLEAVRRATS